MPTNQNAYNSRVTDEALEKRFRDTFTSQGGSELVSDLYASGVIVPVVDFTAAAEGSALRSDLQTAWDFSTGHTTVVNTTSTLITTTGFWKVDINFTTVFGLSTTRGGSLNLTDGLTSKPIWEINTSSAGEASGSLVQNDVLVVFLRAGDSLTCTSNESSTRIDVVYRQIATVNGDLTNPLGFTSS